MYAMKKIVLTILFAAGCGMLMAQMPGTMDTIMGREVTYYYEMWFDSTDFCNIRKPDCSKTLVGTRAVEMAKYNYTDTPLRIMGVAAYCWSEYVPDPLLPCVAKCADTSFDNWYESLILYKPTDSGMVTLASQTYNVRDTSRMMKLFVNLDQLNYPIDVVYLPIYEVFFDEPVVVTDSFYVAFTNYHAIVDSSTMTYPGPRARTAIYEPIGGNMISCYPQPYKWKDQNTTHFEWRHEVESKVWLIFPIVDTMTHICERPQGLHLLWQDTGSACLAWDSADWNHTWQLAYGPADQDPDRYTTLTVATPQCTLTDLLPAVEYAARVRASCLVPDGYSDWGDTVRFTSVGDPLSVAAPDGDPGWVGLQPNPAHDRVTIRSAKPMKHIAIYDLQGHRVMERAARGTAVTISLTALTKGGYVVRTTTTGGSHTAKLTIE